MPCELQGGQDVGVGKFVLERDADNVELVERKVRFEARERTPRCTEPGLIVRPGREYAFADSVLALVQDMIQNAEAEVRHADLVGVWEEEADLRPHGTGIFVYGIDFGVYVPGRLADERKKIFVHNNSRKCKSKGMEHKRRRHDTSVTLCPLPMRLRNLVEQHKPPRLYVQETIPRARKVVTMEVPP